MAVTTEPQAGLQKGTNWWGAFVIGLAGTILVTGIAPYAVQGMGGTAIWAIGINTVFGLVLCLCLAELADRPADQRHRPARAVHPVLLRREAGRELRHLPRRRLDGAAHGLGPAPALQVRRLPLVERRGLP